MNQSTDSPRAPAAASAPRRPYERPRIVKGRTVEQATLAGSPKKKGKGGGK